MPSDRISIDLGRPCLTMTQVLDLLKTRVDTLNQLAVDVNSNLPPSWKAIGPKDEHRASRVCLVYQDTQAVQDESMCVLPITYREIDPGTCASCAMCVAVFHVHRTWKTEKGRPVRITVDVVGLPRRGVSRIGTVKSKIRSYLKTVVLRIANPGSCDLSHVKVRFTTFLSKGERTKYYSPIVSILLDVESSARHRGSLVRNRSAGPRRDINHLKVRKDVCTEVLRKCASDMSFSVVGASTESFRVRRVVHTGRPVSYTYFNGSHWVPLLRSSIARRSGKKTIFVFTVVQGSSASTKIVSCGNFDGDAVAEYLGLPSRTNVVTSQQQATQVQQHQVGGRDQRRVEHVLIQRLRVMGTSCGNCICIETSGPEQDDEQDDDTFCCILNRRYNNADVRVEIKVEQTSCKLSLAERTQQQWTQIGTDSLTIDSVKYAFAYAMSLKSWERPRYLSTW